MIQKDKLNTITQGDCLKVMKEFSDNSIDTLITDPPYGIAFMGQDWDTFSGIKKTPGDVSRIEFLNKSPRYSNSAMEIFFIPIWKECLRVLKPGSFAFVMCSPRADVMAKQINCLQEAGFNVNFTPIFHCFSAGFPKAENISKAIDERECKKQLEEKLDRKPTRKEFEEVWKKFRKVIGIKKLNPKDKKAYMPNKFEGLHGTQTFQSNPNMLYKTAPTAPQAKILDGIYSPSPKPAVEVIIVAQKLMKHKTYVDQALDYANQKLAGKTPDIAPGGVDFDDCRIPCDKEFDKSQDREMIHRLDGKEKGWGMGAQGEVQVLDLDKGRFPANLLCEDDILNDGQNHIGWTGQRHSEFNPYGGTSLNKSSTTRQGDFIGYDKGGSFSRYFSLDKWWEEKIKKLPESVKRVFPFLIVPKASKSEKNIGCKGLKKEIGHNRFDRCAKCGGYILQNPDRPSACKCENPIREHNVIKGNYHPTTKPIKLMSYLIILGSREGDIVLDPFVGSGTTAIACKLLDRKYIAIEMNPEYCEIANCRLGATKTQLKLF